MERPRNAIHVIDGKDGDTNHGMKGRYVQLAEVLLLNIDTHICFASRYVWLVPKWTNKLADASTGVEIVIQGRKDENYRDLGVGAGGDYRYLQIRKDTDRKKYITDLSLYRGSQITWADLPKLGYHGMSKDINEGRGGGYLHILWKSMDVGAGAIES